MIITSGQRIGYSLNTGNDYTLFFGCAVIRNFKTLVLNSLEYHDGTFGTEGWQFNSPELLTLSYSYVPVDHLAQHLLSSAI